MFKITKVVPLFKNRDSTLPENYRSVMFGKHYFCERQP